ncbi:6-pyruvoyl tetrahydrobiopterin synthase [Legionella israelensis]|uniref:6-carboxy-5,6,7,8-tetrahydropterin synthase n=1 Tax=Legionella israelensis TaxID=454 RepID=A0A0W0WQI0_9GAMM|nr:6-carboxytetrahydropterin synthase [Legionella israelensis]KTD34569.1 6-pyruvoyl tetrahydropterin synthase [Legionella israelensis]QBR83132.1 6-pyruvoyl tetrahydrobiopterin synthase [Legionella israelensis]QBS09493.1 6-pyruvoyl tetrahydrobiopterin synthase [Legionella israelensis]QDP71662.1 6-pyruvoyl tetrahydrobiopterin synthase [Legionella israelensis]SCX99680.1 6-pyruvoyltetrahydropterin/6-carboxytetrahydropterin synthase [Legionella israelensis DSM 19235]
MKKYLTTVELQKESMKFSAGHTTIFSATEREPLHGHQYGVYLALTTWVEENGLTFDYRYYKEKIHTLCKYLNQTFLMPQYSPFLSIEEDEDYYYFTFNRKKMPFLKEDVTLLPLTNITVEELSRWFVNELIKNKEELEKHRIEQITVKIFSAPGQSASHQWSRS